MTARAFSLPRITVVAITALVILTPLSLIFWQSFLNAPFFNPAKHLGLDAYRFIFDDPDFWNALLNSVVIAAGMVLIALPLGAALAFLLTRTDLPGQRHRSPGAGAGVRRRWCWRSATWWPWGRWAFYSLWAKAMSATFRGTSIR
jgi:iron(III) transport system permease protein